MSLPITHFQLWRDGESVTVTFCQYIVLCLLVEATGGPCLLPVNGPTWFEWDVVGDAISGLRGWLLGIIEADPSFLPHEPERREAIERFIAWADGGFGVQALSIQQVA